MTFARIYSLHELQGLTYTLSDAVKDRGVFLKIAKDLIGAHPLLKLFIDTLIDQEKWDNLVQCGGVSLKLEETATGQLISVHLPTQCVTDGSVARWGDTLPIEFHFQEVLTGGYALVQSLSNESRAALRSL